MRRTTLFGLAVPLSTLLAAWALVDLTAWFAFPRLQGEARLLVRHDPRLGWSKIPGARTLRITPEYRVDERINSRGLRGPEIPHEKASDTYRILLLGDSFVEGYSVGDEELVSTRLQERLRKSSGAALGGKKLEVINGGTGGYSTDQEYLFLETEGLKYRPDLVVLFLFQNDMHYNAVDKYLPLGRGRKPRFSLVDGRLVAGGVPVPDEAPPFGRAVGQWLMSHSFLVSRASPFLEGTLARIGLHPELPEEFQVFLENPPSSVRQEWELTRHLLGAARDLSERSGAGFVVFHVPSVLEVNEGHFGRFLRHYGKTPDQMTPTRIQQDLARIATEERLELVEPIEVFRSAEKELQSRGLSLYYPHDRHWNARGHDLAATLLADHLGKAAPRGGSPGTAARRALTIRP